jgi:hypothetical protein
MDLDAVLISTRAELVGVRVAEIVDVMAGKGAALAHRLHGRAGAGRPHELVEEGDEIISPSSVLHQLNWEEYE